MCADTAYEFDVYDYNLGVCGSESACVWCNRGIVWFYAFHMEEALYCFRRATEVDPTCAMGYWGMALSHMPNYNFGVTQGYYQAAEKEDGYPSMRQASKCISKAKKCRSIRERNGAH